MLVASVPIEASAASTAICIAVEEACGRRGFGGGVKKPVCHHFAPTILG